MDFWFLDYANQCNCRHMFSRLTPRLEFSFSDKSIFLFGVCWNGKISFRECWRAKLENCNFFKKIPFLYFICFYWLYVSCKRKRKKKERGISTCRQREIEQEMNILLFYSWIAHGSGKEKVGNVELIFKETLIEKEVGQQRINKQSLSCIDQSCVLVL